MVSYIQFDTDLISGQIWLSRHDFEKNRVKFAEVTFLKEFRVTWCRQEAFFPKIFLKYQLLAFKRILFFINTACVHFLNICIFYLAMDWIYYF